MLLALGLPSYIAANTLQVSFSPVKRLLLLTCMTAHYVGYGASAGLLVFSSAVYSTVHVYWRSRNNRKRAGKEDHLVAGLTPEEVADAGDKNPKYLFTI